MAFLPGVSVLQSAGNAIGSGLSWLANQYNENLQPTMPEVFPNFRSQTTPAEKADWYLRDSKTDRNAFNFLRTANNAFSNDRVFDVDGQRLSPAEIVQNLLGSDSVELPEEFLQKTIDEVRRRAVGEMYDPTNDLAGELYENMLGVMRDRSVGGGEAAEDAISFRRAKQWEDEQAQGGQVASYRMSQGAKQNFAAQRTYDLMRTFANSEHANPRAAPMSKVQAAIGTAAYPFVGGALELGGMQDTADTMQVFGDTADIASNSMYGGMLGRAKNALYDYNRAAEGLASNAIQDPISGAYFPDFSSTTQTGLGSKFTDSTNRYAQFARPFRDFIENPPWDGVTGDQREALATAFNELQRPVKRVANPRDAAGIARANDIATQQRNDIDVYNAEWLSAYYPMLVRQFNEQFGTNVEPTFLSPAADILGNLPKEIVSDAFTFATLPIGVAANVARNGLIGGLMQSAKGMARNIVDEVPYEAPPATAQFMGDTGTDFTQLFTPQKTLSSIRDDAGKSVAASDELYPFFREKARQRKQTGLEAVGSYVQDTDAARRQVLPQYNPWSGLSPSQKPPPRRPF